MLMYQNQFLLTINTVLHLRTNKKQTIPTSIQMHKGMKYELSERPTKLQTPECRASTLNTKSQRQK
jgi:hypothetical protein